MRVSRPREIPRRPPEAEIRPELLGGPGPDAPRRLPRAGGRGTREPSGNSSQRRPACLTGVPAPEALMSLPLEPTSIPDLPARPADASPNGDDPFATKPQ